MNAAKFATRIERATHHKTPDGWWTGRCPVTAAHNRGDRNPSLRWRDGDVKISIKCMSQGCARGRVLAALDLTEDDTWLRPRPSPGTAGLTVESLADAKGLPVDFLLSLGVKQDGASVLIEHRLMDGSLAPRHQLRHAGKPKKFTWTGDGDVGAYGLWRLENARIGGYLLLVEGASDCWSGWFHGVPALGIPGDEMVKVLLPEHLKNVAKVYVVHETDKGGDSFAANVAARLLEIGYTGDAFDLRMPDGLKDVNELHLNARQTPEFVKRLQGAMDTAPRLESVVSAGDLLGGVAATRWYERTPGGNRDRLVDMFGEDVAYAPGLGWVEWTGKRWRRDTADELFMRIRAEAVVQRLKQEAESLAGIAAVEAWKWYRKSYARSPMQEMVDMAAPVKYRPAEDFNAKPFLFCCANGTIDLATGEFHTHSKDDLLTQMSPVAYDPAAKAPRWERFVAEVMDGDQQMVAYLQRIAGYCATGDATEHALFVFYGLGANGKTTFLEVLRAALGYDYALGAQITTFLKKQRDGGAASPDLARMRSARLVTASEPERGARLATGLVKQMTGDERQVARHLYKEEIEFEGRFKIVLACNNKPDVRDQTKGMWRRIHFVPWTATFEEGRPGFDKNLRAALLRELPGILNWIVAGARAWRERGLDRPESARTATEEYRQEQDELSEFLADRDVVIRKDLTVVVVDLYKAYTEWCSPAKPALSQKAFTQALQERGVTVEFDRVPDPRQPGKTKAARVYVGVGFVTGVTADTQKSEDS